MCGEEYLHTHNKTYHEDGLCLTFISYTTNGTLSRGVTRGYNVARNASCLNPLCFGADGV
jgi:hypothetical protein